MATKPRPAASIKIVANPPVKKAAKPVARKKPAAKADTGEVLKELKSLAKELNKAAKGLESRKGRKGEPKEISTVLGNVERMTAEAATKSLMEAESAKISVDSLLESLGRDWSRKGIETALKGISGHLTNIMVAQEFQDLAGQSIRQAVKALVGAIIVVEGGGPTEERRLSQSEIDGLLKDLMP
jgi:chemotaxis regulatin CheY-phosphate phosphatase CheZ